MSLADWIPVDAPAVRPAARCHVCGTKTVAPVEVGCIERASASAVGLYACPEHAPNPEHHRPGADDVPPARQHPEGCDD
ncbi:hypothetical protein I5Q34_19695 [Streptomyces sp. AV19]|uniref:hypothetical protein n=1 Tax=Streptomyces sp. AV19 TaxID=2793068 RepID=UPI0018FF03D4|nr:hypothetical protein [Streptomyces sp. AV19]MBH1936472.1 hypothetical protein [Streptomyces sp. AV19]MDG4532528.1 hypothetical protein [Streptomyces sp. AV19]